MADGGSTLEGPKFAMHTFRILGGSVQGYFRLVIVDVHRLRAFLFLDGLDTRKTTRRELSGIYHHNSLRYRDADRFSEGNKNIQSSYVMQICGKPANLNTRQQHALRQPRSKA